MPRGVATSVSIAFHYLHAAPLSTNGGGWIAPDDAHARDVQAGPYASSVIAPRPGHRQTFELDLDNLSDVSQTVLGLSGGRTLANPRATLEPETMQVSTTAASAGTNTPARFTSGPVTIAPNGQYALRFSIVTAPGQWSCSHSRYFTELSLRVRVGAFTRTGTVSLHGLIMEIRSSSPPC